MNKHLCLEIGNNVTDYIHKTWESMGRESRNNKKKKPTKNRVKHHFLVAKFYFIFLDGLYLLVANRVPWLL